MTSEEKSSQCKRIMEFVDRHGSINPMQALTFLAVMRLAARISDLEKAGYRFEHEMTTGQNRFGEKIKYMTYKKVA